MLRAVIGRGLGLYSRYTPGVSHHHRRSLFLTGLVHLFQMIGSGAAGKTGKPSLLAQFPLHTLKGKRTCAILCFDWCKLADRRRRSLREEGPQPISCSDREDHVQSECTKHGAHQGFDQSRLTVLHRSVEPHWNFHPGVSKYVANTWTRGPMRMHG